MSDLLQQYLDSVRATPFKWGEHDCAMFAAKGTDAVYGTQFVARVKSFGCTSALQFRKLQREGATLRALTTAELGEPMSGGMLQRGDVVLVNGGAGDTLGIAVPPLILVTSSEGFRPLPISHVHTAWRIR